MHRSHQTSRGFTTIELMVAIAVTAIGITLASGMMLAGKEQIQRQERQLEATQAGRAALDTILRELRLGGACLPETGEFIALAAVDNDTTDEVVTRYGLTTPDLSCIQTATASAIAAFTTSVPVNDSAGFKAGDYVYIRHTDGSGEYFEISSIDSTNHTLLIDRALTTGYPATSGIYAIDERRFYVDSTASPAPKLMFQVSGTTPQPFALGIEKLDIEYVLADGTPLPAPATDEEWRSVRRVRVDVTARSVSPDAGGRYYRRQYSVSIKPRNLVGS